MMIHDIMTEHTERNWQHSDSVGSCDEQHAVRNPIHASSDAVKSWRTPVVLLPTPVAVPLYRHRYRYRWWSPWAWPVAAAVRTLVSASLAAALALSSNWDNDEYEPYSVTSMHNKVSATKMRFLKRIWVTTLRAARQHSSSELSMTATDW